MTEPIKLPPQPDRVHKGSIEFEIRWYGNQAEIIVKEPDLYKRAAMLQHVHSDLSNLLINMKDQPKSVQKKFTTEEKRRVISAKNLMDKFINAYLNNIWAYEHPTVVKEEIKEELPKESEDGKSTNS